MRPQFGKDGLLWLVLALVVAAGVVGLLLYHQVTTPDEVRITRLYGGSAALASWDTKDCSLVEQLYQHVKGLPKWKSPALCPRVCGSQLQSAFLQGGRTLLTATTSPCGCETLTLGSNDVRAPDTEFYMLVDLVMSEGVTPG